MQHTRVVYLDTVPALQVHDGEDVPESPSIRARLRMQRLAFEFWFRSGLPKIPGLYQGRVL